MKKLLAIIIVLALLSLALHSARTGYAELVTETALLNRNVRLAQQATALSPADPYNHVVLGALLEASGEHDESVSHYARAVALRPDDYLLRLQLAHGQELAGDSNAAINNASIATMLAPSYAQPHWQLGNILIRAGRADGGFQELQQATNSDPKLLPATIDLAWQLSHGDPRYVEQAIAPHTPDGYISLASYFKKRGLTNEASRWLKAGGDATRQERRNYVAELIAHKDFQAAHLVWLADHPVDPDEPLIKDSGFEEETDLDEPGFGWRAATPDKATVLSLDNVKPKEGQASLRVEFNGPTTNGDTISRLVMVQAKGAYELFFSFRTENIVSGGLPYLAVIDANSDKLIAQSAPFPQNIGWTDAKISFTVGESTSAIRIALQRKPCRALQCPIFGKLWLDDFELVGPGVYSRRAR